MKYIVLASVLVAGCGGSGDPVAQPQNDQPDNFTGFYQFDSKAFRMPCLFSDAFNAPARTEIFYVEHINDSISVRRNQNTEVISDSETSAIRFTGDYRFTVSNGSFDFTYTGTLADQVNYNGSVVVSSSPGVENLCSGETFTTVTRL